MIKEERQYATYDCSIKGFIFTVCICMLILFILYLSIN